MLGHDWLKLTHELATGCSSELSQYYAIAHIPNNSARKRSKIIHKLIPSIHVPWCFDIVIMDVDAYKIV